MLCHDSVAGIYQTDSESNMAVKTTVTVCKYHKTPTTRLYTPWNYLMNTDTASLSFPMFLGLTQVV